MVDPAAATLSKREQKRQARMAKELAERASTETGSAQETPAQDSPVPEQSTTESRASPFIEPVQKRIRNYLKKKQKIDQLAERANDPEEREKLNKDQHEQLARKDQILAPLKELQNLAEQFTTIQEEQTKTSRLESVERSQTQAAAIEAAKEEGVKQGRKTLSSLIAFLGFASVLRGAPTDDKEFNDANERLLSLIYLGGDASLEAASNLDAGNDEMIDDTSISFKQVHDAIFSTANTPLQEEADAPSPEASVDHHEDTASGSNFISLADLSQKTSTMSAGGISFLNESEIEGSTLPESIGVPQPDEPHQAPMQTASGEFGSESAAVLDWAQVETPRTNWADDDSLSTPMTDDKALKGGLQPLSDFQTIEKKNGARDNGTRGRGRGSAGRGRGDKVSRGRGDARAPKPKPQ